MHDTALNSFLEFKKTYLDIKNDRTIKVLEIGSGYSPHVRQAINNEFNYSGVDIAQGKNVDVVLKDPYNKEGISEVNTDEIASLEEKINKKLEKIYSNLNPWETTQVARHENRPKAKYFIKNFWNIPLNAFLSPPMV